MPESDQTSPFLLPDFQVTDIAYWPENTRIRIQVRNGGKPFDGNLKFRLNLSDPYSPYTLDKVVLAPVSLNTTDTQWVTLLSDFTWPDPVEYPTLNVMAAADPDNQISENDDSNNHFHKTLRVNCNVHIEALSNYRLVKGKGESFAIYGRFGSRQISDFPQSENGFTLSEHLSKLGPGFYVLKCFQKDQYKIIKYAHSAMFRLQ